MINERKTVYIRERAETDTEANVTNGRSFAAVISDLKNEAKDFAQTRLEMLKAEMREKVGAYKTAVPMFVVAAVFAWTAWFVLTACLVTAIALAFGPGMTSWIWATLIVGIAYLCIAGVAGFFGYSEVKKAKLTPERTIRVLKQDQVWMQNETTNLNKAA